MGARKLKGWLERPLVSHKDIENRLSIVQVFYEKFLEREELRELLRTVYDLERLVGRIAYGNVNARDLVQLRTSLENIPAIKEVLAKRSEEHTSELESR